MGLRSSRRSRHPHGRTRRASEAGVQQHCGEMRPADLVVDERRTGHEPSADHSRNDHARQYGGQPVCGQPHASRRADHTEEAQHPVRRKCSPGRTPLLPKSSCGSPILESSLSVRLEPSSAVIGTAFRCPSRSTRSWMRMAESSRASISHGRTWGSSSSSMGASSTKSCCRDGERASDVVLREKAREAMICRLTGWRCIRVTWAELAYASTTRRRIRAELFPAG